VTVHKPPLWDKCGHHTLRPCWRETSKCVAAPQRAQNPSSARSSLCDTFKKRYDINNNTINIRYGHFSRLNIRYENDSNTINIRYGHLSSHVSVDGLCRTTPQERDLGKNCTMPRQAQAAMPTQRGRNGTYSMHYICTTAIATCAWHEMGHTCAVVFEAVASFRRSHLGIPSP
jgi:hypothetical protein